MNSKSGTRSKKGGVRSGKVKVRKNESKLETITDNNTSGIQRLASMSNPENDTLPFGGPGSMKYQITAPTSLYEEPRTPSADINTTQQQSPPPPQTPTSKNP